MAPNVAYTGAAFLYLLLFVFKASGQGFNGSGPAIVRPCPTTTETISQGITTFTSTEIIITATVYETATAAFQGPSGAAKADSSNFATPGISVPTTSLQQTTTETFASVPTDIGGCAAPVTFTTTVPAATITARVTRLDAETFTVLPVKPPATLDGTGPTSTGNAAESANQSPPPSKTGTPEQPPSNNGGSGQPWSNTGTPGQPPSTNGGSGQPPSNNGGSGQPSSNNGGSDQSPSNNGGSGQPPSNNGGSGQSIALPLGTPGTTEGTGQPVTTESAASPQTTNAEGVSQPNATPVGIQDSESRTDSNAPIIDVSSGTGGIPTSAAPSGDTAPGDSTEPAVLPGGTPTASGQPVEFTGTAHRDNPGVHICLLTMLAGIVLVCL